MAVSSYAKNATMGTISVDNGTSSVTLSYDMGDVSITGLARDLNEAVPVERRGRFVSLVPGARTYPSISFSSIITQILAGASPGDAMDILLGAGAYSSDAGTLGSGRPYTTDITLTIEGTDFGDAADETVTAHDVHCTADLTEGQPSNTVAFSGTVYGEVDVNGTTEFQEIS